MKQKYLGIAEECLAIVANHCVLVAAFLTLVGCFGQTDAHIGLWIVAVALPLFFYFLRRKLANFLLFFLLHIIWPFVAILITGNNLTFCAMYTVLVGVHAVMSIKNKVKDHDKKMEAPSALLAVVVFSVGMLMQSIWGMKSWTNYYMILVFVYFACYYVYLYLNQYARFMLFNKNSTANIPEKEIFTSGFTQTVVYTAGGLGILFLTSNVEWMSYIAGIIGNALLKFIRFLIENVHFSGGDDHGVLGEDDMYKAGEQLKREPVEANEMFEGVLLAVIKVFIVILIILFIFVLIKAFRDMWENYTINKVSEEMMSAKNEVREKLSIEKDGKEERKGRNLFGFMDNKEKVRKYYKKRVAKEKLAIVGDLDAENLQYLTSKECCDKISARNLQNVYDRVRYSEDEITADDVKKAKSDVK